MKKKKDSSKKIDWEKIDPDEQLTITLLRPSLQTLRNAKKLAAANSKKSQRRQSSSAHEK